jgi:hypothetical protein
VVDNGFVAVVDSTKVGGALVGVETFTIGVGANSVGNDVDLGADVQAAM